ncbi:hypothetical protein V9L05_14365 [Bernardetia sp. Wsw4-3y2]|uniref:hypothetical protein n=1 Tax=unclassified Bernardetia TaxID=2647129 RepID=UPI0030CD3FDD
MSENQLSDSAKKKIARSYHLQFGGFALVMLLCMLAFQFFVTQYYIPQVWGVYIGITLLYWITGMITLRFLGSANFGYAMMVSKMVRMLFCASVMLAYVMISGEGVISLAFVMLFLYFGYLLFEIRALLPNLQRNSEQDSEKP